MISRGTSDPMVTPEERIEEHTVEGGDGWKLSVLDLRPARAPRAIVIAGHAMMVDRRTLWRPDRPTLGRALLDAGLRVLIPDQRGHGHSAGTGDWSYDDLVDDTGPYVQLARNLEPRLPLVLLGHSLFGHTSLAWAGQHPEVDVAAHVLLSVNLWSRHTNRGLGRLLAKRALVATAGAVSKRVGKVPVKALGLGTADESLTYFECFGDQLRHGRWWSKDGVDYWQNLRRIPWPVLQVTSAGDRWLADHDEALRFTAPLPQRTVLTVGPNSPRPALRDLSPGHMQLVTSPRSMPVWQAVASWICDRAQQHRGG